MAALAKLERQSLVNAACDILKFNIDDTTYVVAIFDIHLNYLVANDAACSLLSKERDELEGKNMLHIFPALTASVSHKNLLIATSGTPVFNVFSDGHVTKDGAKFISNYYPLKDGNETYAVVAFTRTVYFP